MDSISSPLKNPPSISLYNIDRIIETGCSPRARSWYLYLGMCDTALVNPDQPGAADEIGGRRRKRQKISRVIRAVFIETSLARKIRNRKLRRQSSRWDIKEPSETTDDGSVDLNPTSPKAEVTQLSSPTTSDATTICLLSENEAVSKEKKRGDNFGMFKAYFFPMVLLVLIFLGKLCAIFFTSTWLFGISSLGSAREGSFGGKGLHLKHYLRGPLSDF